MKIVYLPFIVIGLILTSCGGGDSHDSTDGNHEEEVKREVSAESAQKLDEIRELLKSIPELLPAEGEEVEFLPDTVIADMGLIDNQENRRVFTLREPHLISIANKAPLGKKGGKWFSAGRWEVFNDDPFEDEDMEVEEFDKIVNTLSGMNYLGVMRLQYYSSGELQGEDIIENAYAKGWYWIINVKTKDIICCAYVDELSDSYILTMDGNTDNLLSDNLYGNVFDFKNAVVNQYAGTKEEKYVGHYVD